MQLSLDMFVGCGVRRMKMLWDQLIKEILEGESFWRGALGVHL